MDDNEILDDDFDIEDDFEDDFDLDDADISEVSDEVGAAGDQSPKKKSPLQRFFLPIVIAVVALFGLIFAAGQGLFKGSETNTAIVNATETENVISDKIDTASKVSIEDATAIIATEATVPQDSIAGGEFAAEEDQPLTPLLEENTAETIALADLDAELLDSPATVDIDDTIPELTQDPIISDAMFDEEILETEIDPIPAFEPNSDVTKTAIADDESGLAEDIIAENTIIDDAQSNEIKQDSALMPVENDTFSKEIEALKSEKDALIAEKETLSNEINNQRLVISELKAEIEALAEDKRNTAEKNAAKSKKQPASIQPVKTAERPQKRKAAPKISWELRSAQPGKATLAKKGSNDLKTIEVGSFLNSLGRIQSIQIENGLWVVRGSKGNISQ